MRISENRIKEIIKEVVEEVTFGNVKHFTPYTPEEREQNFKGLTMMRNPAYDAFIAWRNEGLRRGIPSRQLSWDDYQKELKNR